MKAIELIRRISEIVEKEKRWAEHIQIGIFDEEFKSVKNITKVEYDPSHGGDGIMLS